MFAAIRRGDRLFQASARCVHSFARLSQRSYTTVLRNPSIAVSKSTVPFVRHAGQHVQRSLPKIPRTTMFTTLRQGSKSKNILPKAVPPVLAVSRAFTTRFPSPTGLLGIPHLTPRIVRWAIGTSITLTALTAGLVWTVPPLFHAVHGSLRFLCCLAVGSYIALDYKISLRGLEGETRSEKIHEVHNRSAHTLLRLFQFNKGIFIKFGQHLCALEYILPREYTQAMTPLQSHAPTRPFSDIVKVIEDDFGAHPDEIFTYFERVPIAAASLAQVHIAEFRGKKVAVKVQFPSLKETCKGDVWTISVLVKAVAYLFPEFQFKWLVDEINANLPFELDFRHEAKNSERMARLFRGNSILITPPIMWPLTSSRVLTMDFMEGVHITDVEGMRDLGISPSDVMDKLSTVFGDMIFRHGFVHCDPHPGNVLVRPHPSKSGAQIVLLDHGLYKELPDEFRLDYSRLWKAIIDMDEPNIERLANKLNAPQYRIFASMLTARAWDYLQQGADNLDGGMTEEEKVRIRDVAQDRIGEIIQTLDAVPSELLLLFKTNDLLRSINAELGHPVNTFIKTSHIVNEVLREQSIIDDPSLTNRLSVLYESTFFAIKLHLVNWTMWFYSWWTGKHF